MQAKPSLLSILVVALALGSASISAPVAAQSVAVDWNRLMLDAIAANAPAPTQVTWRLHLMSSAMYDAWAAYDETALGTEFGSLFRRPASEHSEENQEKAVSYAAYRALSYVYPTEQATYQQLMATLGFALSESRDPSTPEGIGNLMANAAIASRQNDGANVAGDFDQTTSPTFPQLYAPTNSSDPNSPNAIGGMSFDPNRWTPVRVPTGELLDNNGEPIVDDNDPATFVDQEFLSPHWGAVRPFAMPHGSQFLPQDPPQKNSPLEYTDALGQVMTNHEAWIAQTTEVVEFSRDLTTAQKISAEFWADGPRSWTPPGHWNQFAQGLSIRDQNSVGDDVRMFFALNAALYDTAIATWDAKRRIDYIRPISAIRDQFFGQQIVAWAGPNQGTGTISGETWSPYQASDFVTPAFGEYTSGHSGFSRAAREVLLGVTGTDQFYDGSTRYPEDFDGDGENDLLGEHITPPGGLVFEDGPEETVILRWDTLLEAADAAGLSRIYGGIHFQDGDLFGRELGRQVGLQALARAQSLWTGQPVASPSGACVETDYTVCLTDRWASQIAFSTVLSGSPLAGAARGQSLAPLGAPGGALFTFFDATNPEAIVKVIDGCDVNSYYWVAVSAATNVGFSVQITDAVSGQVWTSSNADGDFAQAVVDTTAFPCQE